MKNKSNSCLLKFGTSPMNNPNELTISLIRRTLINLISSLTRNETIKTEILLKIWKELYKTEFTECML